MSHQAIINDIKNNKIAPVYLLGGQESYFIDIVSDFIEKNILDETEVAFNMDIFYGLEVVPEKVISICKEFPMMAERRIVIIKEAQKILNLELFDDYILNPSPTTVFVIIKKGKTFDKRRKVYNPKNNKNIALLNTAKIADYKLAGWIESEVKSNGYLINQSSSQLLSEHLGNDLSKIKKELEKLYISVKKGSSITPDDIEQNIGISKDYNIFELQKAIGYRDYEKAFQIMIYFSENPKVHPIQMTIATLNGYFTKLMLFYYSPRKGDSDIASQLGISPYFVKEYREAAKNYPAKKVVSIISLLREYDLKSKGYEAGSAGYNDWHKELLFKIMF